MLRSWAIDVLTSASVVAVLFGLLGYLFRNILMEHLKRAVGHEYDQRLEALRLQNQKILDEFREARSEREAFRTLAFSLLTSAHTATAAKKTSAIETLWAAFLTAKRSIPGCIGVVDMVGYEPKRFGDALANELRGTKFLDALQPLLKASDRAIEVRPFVGEQSFALYWSAQALFGQAISTTLSSFQAGKLEKWYEESETKNLLTSTLSRDDYDTFMALTGDHLSWLQRHLEDRLVVSMTFDASGEEVAQATLEKARRILAAAARPRSVS